MAGTSDAGRRRTRDDVVDAALGILDEHGLAELTMRRLATALEVQPSALYWHVESKQALLAAVADRIVARLDAGVGSAGAAHGTDRRDAADWRGRTHAVAASLRRALLASRDGAEVVQSTLALDLGATAPLEHLEAALAGSGHDEATRRRAARAVLHFVLGQVGREQQRQQYDRLGIVAGAPAPAKDAEAELGFGVELLVAGLASREPGTPIS
ncbi:TetR family transcriptional regulator [Homoserinibacter sp. YIM 151385]|uniref:TetR family transcriptional regulator n=1 Tax=Homoserinibacter sp. YIM 151385 TaxID=2985506 RepID=UPI0022EFF0DA|nr:TetR family transcriptional regulator [Homoserinibacter sp. YIM 151385]WBU38787.1 TetR family transcriptional regulator [Homoserinibacter sp. YIM 151385]